ncbi:MAG: hypothetical protein KUG65_13190 [Sphingomonadaceae bacterium]|nr:hypothetical protein [Sphingomonadaceae bacterium]
MTLRTALVISGDSTSGQKAVADVEKAMARAEKEAVDMSTALDRADGSTKRLTADTTQAKTALDKYSGSSAKAAAEQRLLASGIDTTGKEWERASVALGGMSAKQAQAAASGRMVVASTGAQKAGMQQLSYQLGDVSTMFALGARPMQIFASQSGQVVQAVQLMMGGTSKVATFLGGPWGMALTGATLVLVPLIGRLFETKDALDDVADAADSAMSRLMQSINQSSKVSDVFTDEGKKLITAQAQVAQLDAEIKRTKADADALVRSLGGGEAAAPLYQKLGELEKKRAAAQEDAEKAQSNLNQAMEVANTVVPMQTRNQERLNSTTEKSTRTSRKQTKSLSDQERAYKQAYTAADRYIESLDEEIERIGKTPKELRALEVAHAMAAAATDEQRAAIKRLSEQREFDLGLQQMQRDQERSIDWKKSRLDPIEREIALLGLVGPAREKVALALEKEAFKAEAVENKVGDAESAWQDYYEKQLRLIDGRSYIEEQLEQARMLEDQIRALTGALAGMGGIGGQFGNVLGALSSGNPAASLLGMGGIGTLAGGLLSPGSIAGMGVGVEGGLNSLLGLGANGSTAMLGQALAGGGFGAAIGSPLGKLTGSKSGGQIGGALGGAAFGPVGAIGGALLGGLVGGAVKSTKRGGATIGANDNGVGIVGGWGNSSSRRDTATQLAEQAIGGLRQIIETLGGELGSFSGSVSVRKDSLRYDPTGSGISKTSKGALDFGQDSAALIEAILEDAFADGAAKGLSEGVQRLLQGDGDIDARIAKAQAYQTVLGEIHQTTDPLNTALAAFAQQEAEIIKLLDEAGASAEDRVLAEQFLADKRQEIVEQFNREEIEKERAKRELLIQIMEAEGDAVGALAAQRELERETMAAGLLPFKERLWALEDEARKLEQAAQATAEHAASVQQSHDWAQRYFGLHAEVLRLEGDLLGAVTLERNLELAATEESLRALTMRKFGLQDEAEALAKVQAIAAERYNLETRLLQLMGNQAALNLRELEQADPANRALLAHIQSIERQKSASEEAARAAQAQASALQSTAQQFRNFAQGIREFRAGLVANDNYGEAGYSRAKAEYLSVADLASRGNVKGLEGFTGAAKSFLDASLDSASSYVQYRRDIAMVAGAADNAIAGADARSSLAEQQIVLLQQQASSASANVEGTQDVAKLLKDLEKTQATELVPDIQDTMSTGFDSVVSELALLRAEVAALHQAMNANAAGVVPPLRDIEEKLSNWDRRDHVAVTNDSDTPITTQVAA